MRPGDVDVLAQEIVRETLAEDEQGATEAATQVREGLAVRGGLWNRCCKDATDCFHAFMRGLLPVLCAR